MKLVQKFYLFAFLGLVFGASGQTLTVELDPIDSVIVGGGFELSGRIVHDGVSPPVTTGTPIQLDLRFNDPSNRVVQANPTIVFSGGFDSGDTETFRASFTMPWAQGTQTGNWTAHAVVTGGGNPFAQDTFTIIRPDLEISSTFSTPATVTPGSFLNLRGTISNGTVAASEPQQFFRVRATLNGHTEEIIFPDRANFPPNVAWPIIGGAQDLNFTFPNFFIPENTPGGTNTISLVVDSSGIIPEDSEANTQPHIINVNAGINANISATILFDDEQTGAYQGLDPIRLKLVGRNIGTGAVNAADNFSLSVALSEDITFDLSDYVLREVNLGGGANALGLGLLPNETITVDWVQLLPDNFEGDFYFLVSLNNQGVPLFVTETPVISLRSEDSVNLSHITEARGGRSARPSTTDDGKLVVFESFDAGANHIWLHNIETDQTVLVSSGLFDNALLRPPGNDHSYAPKISGDGRFVVFHSFASNLVNGDNNRHSDVFVYNVYSEYLSKVSNGYNRPDSNEGSFYPTISRDGKSIAFESESTNLDSNGSASGVRQIYFFDHNTSNGSGKISKITNGNADSFNVSIDANGSRMVFTTLASDLIQTPTDINGFSDVILWDKNDTQKFYYAGRTERGELPDGGDTKEAVISGNGEFVAFISSAPNMVTEKGISFIEIIDQGLGYAQTDAVNFDDSTGNGQGAVARIDVDGNGAILRVIIDNPGRNYITPTITITRASQAGRDANVTAHLVNPYSDVFRISVNSIKNNGSSSRVSESQKISGETGSEFGGNERSREPTIDRTGSLIAYSTKASNLLDLNITSTNRKVFPNQSYRPARARAIFTGGIGKIIIGNPGTGYPNSGSFLIQDLSGNGSGAVVTYEVDVRGQIGSVNVVNPGTGYDLENTIITIQNPGTGTGFAIDRILHPPITGTNPNNRQGGASIHRLEMIDSGIGYPQKLHSSMEKPIITVDGDGLDADGIDANGDGFLDGDGQADARMNPDLIHFGTNGEIYLEQQFDITVEDSSALLSTTLNVGDYDRNISLNFASLDNLPFTIGVNGRDEIAMRDLILQRIRNLWANPTDIFDGPLFDNNQTGGTSFRLSALNGAVSSNNLSALKVSHLSNMVIAGSGFTRATPQILPAPVIHGFSEIATNAELLPTGNGRPTLQFIHENITDDIYLYEHNTSRNQRVSVSGFGYPTNYLANTNMSSHRFPTISSDGRYVFFSSDAGGEGGIIFNSSNQDFNPDNNRRDIFLRDMKSTGLFEDNLQITINEDILNATNHKINLNSEYPILITGEIQNGSFQSVSLFVNGQLISASQSSQSGSQAFKTFIPWTPNRVGSHVLYAEIIDNLGNVKTSNPVTVNVVEIKGAVDEVELNVNPILQGVLFFLRIPTVNPQTGAITFTTQGPFTREEIEDLVQQGLILPGTLAYYDGQSPLAAVPFFEVYPFRLLVTNGSSLVAHARFIGRDGKEPSLSKVSFFLNGKLLSDQVAAPYNQNFIPPTLNDDGKSQSFRWALTVVAQDTQGNSFINTEYGENQSSVVFPVMNIDLVNGISGLSENEILNGQVITIDGEITGAHSDLIDVNNISFAANGIVFANSGQPEEVNINRIVTSTNNLIRISFSTLFDVEFEKYAKPDGSIEITVFADMVPRFGFTPIFKSNTLNLNVSPPVPWMDVKSNLLTLFSDLTFRNPSSDEIAYALDNLNSSGTHNLEKWINDISSVAAISDKIDIVSAHRVIYGEWHTEFKKFEEDSLIWSASSSATPDWLKSYIDSELISVDYRFRYGIVPWMVGDLSNASVVNFLNNRYDFIKTSFKNKYGFLPSLQQLYQGSFNMLQYWQSYENTYWELERGGGRSTGVDTPPRRDAIAVGSNALPWDSTRPYSPGEVVNLNRFEYVCLIPGSPAGESPPGSPRWAYVRTLGYNNGEVAVDFVWRFAKEIEFRQNVPYIQSTTSIRDSHFKLATFMHLLWKENADILTDADVEPLSELPTHEAIAKILQDPRYTARYNLIWKNSSLIQQGFPDWKNEPWFGNFWDKNFPWVYHTDLGWIYIAGVSQTAFWFYSDKLGWMWTGIEHYPKMYSNNESSWVYFYDKLNTENYFFPIPYLYIYNTKNWVLFDSYK